MLVFGGHNLYGDTQYLDDVWILQETDSEWSWNKILPQGSGPGGRSLHSAFWDTDTERMIIYGGRDRETIKSDLWALSESDGSWSWSPIAPEGEPTLARAGHSLGWDQTRGLAVVYGGTSEEGHEGDVSLLIRSDDGWRWEQLAPEGLSPSVRQRRAAAWAGDRLFMYGGSEVSVLTHASLWALAVDGDAWRWQQEEPVGERPPALESCASAWDPRRHRLLLTGGSALPVSGDVWAYEQRDGAWRWTKLQPLARTPAGHYAHSAALADDGNTMIVFGGTDGYRPTGDLWTATRTGGGWTWSLIQPDGMIPGSNSHNSATWDPDGQRMVVFGRPTDATANELLVLARAGESWGWERVVTEGPAPSSRNGHSAVWDRAGSQMLVFGGIDGWTRLSDVWSLRWTGRSWVWSELSPTGSPPEAMAYHGAAWDPENERMVVVGGGSVWALERADGQWTWRSLPDGPSGVTNRSGAAMFWDPMSGRILLHGGSNGSYMDDVWALENDGDDWTWTVPIIDGDTPTGRQLHTALWDADRRQLLMYGGRTTGTSALNDFWVLDASSERWVWSPAIQECETAPTAPQSLVPADGSSLDTCGPRLEWEDTGAGRGYAFRVYVNGELAGETTETRLTLPTTFPLRAAENTWYVEALGCPGRTAISASQSFSLSTAPPEQPTLLPVGDIDCDTELPNTFSWDGDDALYDFVLNGEVVRTGVHSTSVSLPAGFAYVPENTWHVVAQNCLGARTSSDDGVFAASSDIVVGTPTITAPDNNATVYCDPTFTWSYPGGSDGVRFDIVAIDGTVLAASIEGTSHTLKGDELLDDGTIYYRVVARNGVGESVSSGARSVVVSNAPPTPELAGPGVDEVTSAEPLLRWTLGDQTAPDVSAVVVIDGVEYAPERGVDEYVPAAPLQEGEHTWRVVATGCRGATATSETRRFHVVASGPGAFSLLSPHDSGWFDASAATVPLRWEPAPPGLAPVEHYEVLVDGVVVDTVADGEEYIWRADADVLVAGPYGGSGALGRNGSTCHTTHEFFAEAGRTYRVDGCGRSTNEPVLRLEGVCDNIVRQRNCYGPDGRIPGAWASCTPTEDGTIIVCASSASNTTATWSYLVTTTGPMDGVRRWSVRAVDAVGNRTDAEQTWSFGVDSVEPEGFGLLEPADGTSTSGSAPAFSWSPSRDLLSGIDHYDIELDGQLLATVDGQVNEWTTAEELPEGRHVWNVTAVDGAGNLARSNESHELIVDRTPPDTVALLDVRPRDANGFVSSLLPTFEFTGADNPGSSGVVSYELLVDGVASAGGPVQPGAGGCVPNTCADAYDILAEGAHVWQITATDAVGMSTSSPEATFVIDISSPGAFTHSTPADGATVDSQLPRLCWNESVDHGSGVASYRLTLSTSGQSDIELEVGALPGTGVQCVRPESELPGDEYAWLVTAVDGTGRTTDANGGTVWHFEVGQDESAPVASLDTTRTECSPGGGVLFSFAGTASDPGPDPDAAEGTGVSAVEVQVDGFAEDGWVAATLTNTPGEAVRTWEWSWSGTGDGDHILYVRATDVAGNVQSPPGAFPFAADCVGPEPFALLSPADDAWGDGCPRFEWEPTSDLASALEGYQLGIVPDDGSDEIVIDVGLATEHTLADGNCIDGGAYEWWVRASDAAGNATISDSPRTYYVDTAGPRSFSLVGASPLEGEGWSCNGGTVTLTWEATVDEGGIPGLEGAVGLADLPYQISLDGELTDWQDDSTSYVATDLADGRHRWGVRARDRNGNITQASGTSSAGDFVVDCLPPEPFALTRPENGRSVSTDRPELCWLATGDRGTGVESYEIRLGGVAVSTIAASEDEAPGDELCWDASPPITDGVWSWSVLARDGAGRTAESATWQFTYGQFEEPPSTTIEQPTAGQLSGPAGIELSGSAAVGGSGHALDRVEVFRQSTPGASREAALVAEPDGAYTWSLHWEAEEDGDTTFCARAWDIAGNSTPTSGAFAVPCVTVSVDISPPEPFELTSPQDGAWTGPLPVFEWAPTSDRLSGVLGYYLLLDGQPPLSVGNTDRHPLSEEWALTSGEHSWTVRADDALGNSQLATTTRSLRVDATPPAGAAPLSPGDQAWVSTQTPELCWSPAVDDESGLAGYTVTLDGTERQIAAGDTCWSMPTPLAEGPHTWHVRAQDVVGNRSPTGTPHAFHVDVTPPPTPSPLLPEAGSLSAPNPPIFTWELADDSPEPGGSGVCNFVVTFAGETRLVEGDVFAYAWPTAVDDGEWTWTVGAVDCAGNVGGESLPRRLFVDGAAPSAPELTTPTDGGWVPTDRPTVRWYPATDERSGICEYTVELAGLTARLSADARSWTPDSPLSGAEHVVRVSATDCAGNAGPADTAQFGVDMTAPTAASLLTPTMDACVDSVSPTFRWTPCEDDGSGLVEQHFLFDGEPLSEPLEPSDTSLQLPFEAEEGPHSWTIVCTDAVGLGTNGRLQLFHVDVTAPTVALESVLPDGDTPTALRTLLTATDGAPCGLSAVELSVDDGDWFACVRGETEPSWSCQWRDPVDGSHLVRARATDTAGNRSAPVSYEIELGPCRSLGDCSEESRECSTTAPDGTVCDDGDGCTTDDSCTGGACLGTPRTCDDQDPCTSDSCADGVCVHQAMEGCCRTQSDCGSSASLCDPDRNICTPVHCAPCLQDSDCGAAGNRCAEMDSGRYCAVACTDTSAVCPDESQCAALDDALACLPTAGDCRCVATGRRGCVDGDAHEVDSCGQSLGVVEICDGRGCAEGVCCLLGEREEGGVCVPVLPGDDAGPSSDVDRTDTSGTPDSATGDGDCEAPTPDSGLGAEDAPAPGDAPTLEDGLGSGDAPGSNDSPGSGDATGAGDAAGAADAGCAAGGSDTPPPFPGSLVLLAVLLVLTARVLRRRNPRTARTGRHDR